MADATPDKDPDHARGLAERSVNTSIVPPNDSRPSRGAPADGSRVVTGNDQRKGSDNADPPSKSPKAARE